MKNKVNESEMEVQVTIDRTILSRQDGTVELSSNVGTVSELLDQLDREYTGFRDKCINSEGRLKRGYHIAINGIEIDFLRRTKTVLKDGDRISITSKAPYARQIYLTLPREIVNRPIVWTLGNRFNLVTNIRGAKVSKDSGILALELIGEKGKVQEAIAWLRKQSVKVEPIPVKPKAKPQAIQ